MAEAAGRLEQLYETGVRTIVDLTVLGLGRNLPLILEVAARTRMNIVVATGIYTFDEVPRPFRMKGPGAPLGGPEPMVQLFVDEITGGIGATGVRPAVLKCATGIQGVTPGVERVLRAVAQAHLITGLPISTHTVARLRHGVEQQRIFAEEGVDLNHVVIGHCGDSDDLSYLRSIADKGSYLGLDQFGIGHLAPLGQRIDLVVELCRLGYSERIVLSHDFACYADVLDDESQRQTQSRLGLHLRHPAGRSGALATGRLHRRGGQHADPQHGADPRPERFDTEDLDQITRVTPAPNGRLPGWLQRSLLRLPPRPQ